MNLIQAPLSLEECERTCESYNSQINYLQIFVSLTYWLEKLRERNQIQTMEVAK